jgi:hypothetical protein
VATAAGAIFRTPVLRSGRAIEVNIEIMRAFVRLRQSRAPGNYAWRNAYFSLPFEMILGYRDKRTRAFAAGKRVKAFSSIERSAQLKLDRHSH